MYILTDLETGAPLDRDGEKAKTVDSIPRFETRIKAARFAADNWIEYFLIERATKKRVHRAEPHNAQNVIF